MASEREFVIRRIRWYATVLVRHVPPLRRSDVFYLLRVATIHHLVDLWQPKGKDMDYSLVDRAQDEWERILLDAVPLIYAGSLPPEITQVMDRVKAAERHEDREFHLELHDKIEKWIDDVRADIRQLIDEPGSRDDGGTDRAHALREAHHALMAQVPGYQRMTATDKEMRNVRDALRAEGCDVGSEEDENLDIGLVLTWMDLHGKAGDRHPFMFKDKDGQWRTTTERVRDMLRRYGSEFFTHGPGKLWPTKRGRKGKTVSLDRPAPIGDGRTLGEVVPGPADESATNEALRDLRDLHDHRLEEHPPLKDVAAIALDRAGRPTLLQKAATDLRALLTVLDAHRGDRGFQAALVYEWGRGGAGRPKGWTAEGVAESYGVSANLVRKGAERARNLLVERGLRRSA